MSSRKALDLVVDSTGLKIYGQGAWQQERFGQKKSQNRCAWRKLHLGIDPDEGTIVASALSDQDVADVTVLPEL